MTRKRLAVDVGGTFIDFVLFDEATGTVQIEKVPSSGRLERRVMEGIDQLGAGIDEVYMIIHGSTLVVNTILQETGARIGLITTQGFRDVYELGRGNRAEIYNLFYRPPKPLVPRYLRYEVCERINARGEVLEPLDESQAREIVRRLKADSVEGIAIVFLHAYANPTHERRMAQIAEEKFSGAVVSISSDIVREWREFERTSTTVLNAYTRPRLAAYLAALDRELRGRDFKGTLNIMQSSGGMTSSTTAQNVPIRTLESGPAGGVIGAAALGQTLNVSNLVSADVGGTTFDVALIVDGQPFEKAETTVNGRPVLQPTIDVISIGAGGGSSRAHRHTAGRARRVLRRMGGRSDYACNRHFPCLSAPFAGSRHCRRARPRLPERRAGDCADLVAVVHPVGAGTGAFAEGAGLCRSGAQHRGGRSHHHPATYPSECADPCAGAEHGGHWLGHPDGRWVELYWAGTAAAHAGLGRDG